VGISYTLNTRLVRGLDYYGKTVFEWVTDRLGAQGTVCAGGRYDGLVEQLGGPATAAVGFAVGLERLIALLSGAGYSGLDHPPHAYLVMVGEAAERRGLVLAEGLHNRWPELRLQANCGGGSFKTQLKRADRSRARLALILGDEEVNSDTIAVKFLRETLEQTSLSVAGLDDYLRVHLALPAQ
jgi:histidyl-tRNA synthetase